MIGAIPRRIRYGSRAVDLALHEEQRAEHGGPAGVRDEGLLDSALARPRNRHLYAEADIAALAAAYAFGLVKNHPFVDGNKRVSFVVTELFLELNGCRLNLADRDIVEIWFALAAGDIGEEALAERLRAAIDAREADAPERGE